jgi:AcrR family transcriptional regulator
MNELIKTQPPSNSPSRRERGKVEKRRRILDAGTKLFSKNGYEQTTVQQIADEADIAVGTLFLYVRDKSDLLLQIFTERLQGALDAFGPRLQSGAFRKSVLAYFAGLLALYEEDADLSRYFWREFLVGRQESRDRVNVATEIMLTSLQNRLRVAKDKGEIGEQVDPSLGALHLYAIFQATISFHLAHCGPFASSTETLTALLDSFWKGLRKPWENDPGICYMHDIGEGFEYDEQLGVSKKIVAKRHTNVLLQTLFSP